MPKYYYKHTCIDLHCECGHHWHEDAEFLYVITCPECKRVYALWQNIKLIKLTKEQAEFYENR